ncbi:Transport and Golgi organization 2-like protein [Quillaja saponaria]|uniref:Transport and Golgi organization 2-like protein n=1 Tax=Quillaja saponaria TaxID=32244 RepID=A0AAD7PLL9_QUISA|nr:Transport and Golgi organization 2-like protein [Quillaja saponaria]
MKPKGTTLKFQKIKHVYRSVVWDAHALYPFLLFLNRDEYHSRPTKPLAWWEGERILGGRDGLAGGTWLASTRDGRVAFLTNFREIQMLSAPKSRGDLPVRFLESTKSPLEFAEEILKEANQYNGFNLMLTDICSRTMVYVTCRSKDDNFVIKVPPGIHVLTNASLDTPWPKAERLRDNFKELLDQYGEVELPIKEMVEKLMRNTSKDEESLLPKIYPPEREYYLSSIFVEADFPLGRCGTRSSSALSVKTSGEVSFYETYLHNDEWKDKTVTYQVEVLK